MHALPGRCVRGLTCMSKTFQHMTRRATGSGMGSNTLTQLSDQTNRVMFTCSRNLVFMQMRNPLCLQSHVHTLKARFPLHACLMMACSLPFTHICLFQSPASLLCGEKLSGIFFIFFSVGAFWQRDHAHSQPSDPVSALTSARSGC